MAAEHLTPDAVLAAIPQQRPFRFVDRILEIDEAHAVGCYRFRKDEFFYAGHFPGNPITPGVILIETLAQIGVVALGIFLAAKSGAADHGGLITVFTESTVEFRRAVLPGEEVLVTARKAYFRRLKLRVEAEMTGAGGTLVCSGELAGMGVRRP